MSLHAMFFGGVTTLLLVSGVSAQRGAAPSSPPDPIADKATVPERAPGETDAEYALRITNAMRAGVGADVDPERGGTNLFEIEWDAQFSSFFEPTAAAIDLAGDLIIAGSANNADALIRSFDSAINGPPPGDPCAFQPPLEWSAQIEGLVDTDRALRIDLDGFIYVVTRVIQGTIGDQTDDTASVYKMRPESGAVMWDWPLGVGQDAQIALDPDGIPFVATRMGGQGVVSVFRIDPNTGIDAWSRTFATSPSTAVRLEVDRAGCVWLATTGPSGAATVHRLSPDNGAGTSMSFPTLGTPFIPTEIKVDGDGRAFLLGYRSINATNVEGKLALISPAGDLLLSSTDFPGVAA
ncbi:MAG: hypothetical protein KDA21_10020, partial [Phycisphaerales bacterium]|nr:hypothetical protein [Phycisphaerales bacterium]